MRLGPARAAPPLTAFLSACANHSQDRFSVAAFSLDGSLLFETPLPERGHGAAQRPEADEVAVFARRPGDYLVIVDRHSGQIRHTLPAASGRHFYGHGVYSADGARLYTTENAYDDPNPGVIGVYDAANGYRRLGEMDCGGIGPHDIRLMPDGETLVVAVGGILTHPDTDRLPLNIPHMDPSLTYLEAASGRVLEQVRQPPDLHQNSMRHLAVTPDQGVLCVQQWEGEARPRPPLVALHRRGDHLRLLQAPEPLHSQLRNYCGSCCCDASGRIGAVSSPRGGLITLWDLAAAQFLEALTLPDGCGLAADGTAGGFVITSGIGGGLHHQGHDITPLTTPALRQRRWDNHLLRLL